VSEDNETALREAAIWYQEDAAWLHREIRRRLDSEPSGITDWLAARMQNAAAHSARQARYHRDLEKT
jgi:hypothetical protein